MKYSALIIDDEKLARERLARLLIIHQNEIEILGEASDGKEGLELAEKLQPDLLFLDIQMPIMDGFQLLEKLSFQCYIIFTSAYDHYALQAFEENSIDYLLKPIEAERLAKSINKLALLEKRLPQKDLARLISQVPRETLRNIPIHKTGKIIFLKVEDIVYLEAQDKYLMLFDKDGNEHLLSGTLKEYEQKLGSNFLRIHRSHLINTDQIIEIRKTFNGRYTFILNKYESKALQSSQTFSPLIKKLLHL